MKIVYIVPGTGGAFYCENCIRDMNLARAMSELGHDVTVVPMYLPLMPDELSPPRSSPIFYGAVALYLAHISPFFRRLPRCFRRLFDAMPILRLAGRRAGSTRAAGLEELTLSMLRGEGGGQAQELDRLCDWLSRNLQPDIVHLSNALLLGLACRLKQQLNARMVCSLQDEDAWVDAMPAPYREQVWALMAERGRDVDAFAAVSRHFADQIGNRMAIPPDRLHVVHLGADTQQFTPADAPPDPPAIGYLSRMCEAMGLGLLVDAFIDLKRDRRFSRLRLRAAGGSTADDKPFIEDLRRRLGAAGFLGDVDFVAAFDRTARAAFLRSLHVMSVPVLKGEAFGLYQIEALAGGVPVVQPALGAFPEVAELTGGSVIYTPNDAPSLAAALAALLTDPDRRSALGERGRNAVLQRFSLHATARAMATVYETGGTLP